MLFTLEIRQEWGECCDLIPRERPVQEPALNASFNYTKQRTVLNQNLMSSLPKYSVKCYTSTITAFFCPPPPETADLLTGSRPPQLIAVLVVVKSQRRCRLKSLGLRSAVPFVRPDPRQHRQ